MGILYAWKHSYRMVKMKPYPNKMLVKIQVIWKEKKNEPTSDFSILTSKDGGSKSTRYSRKECQQKILYPMKLKI